MALTMTEVTATELEAVDKKVPVLFEREGPFYAGIEKRPVTVVSTRDMRVPLEIRPGGQFGHFDPAGGSLGRGDGPTFDKATLSTVNLKFGVEWHLKAEWATDDARKAAINAFRHLTAKAMSEFRRHLDSLCMTSGNGVVATISSVTSTAGSKDTYQLDSSFGARLVRFGQKVNVYSSDLTTHRTSGGEVQIDMHDLVNGQIRVNANVASSTSGDKIVVSGLSGASPVSLFGVPYHHNNASTGTWLGMNRANYTEIRAYGIDANGGALTLPLPRRALNRAMDRVGKEQMPKVEAWMHPCQVQAYEELGQLVSQITKTTKDEGLNLYFGEAMQLAGAPIKTHFSWDKKRIDFINKESWARAEMHAPGILDMNGRKIFELRGSDGGVAAAKIFYIVASFNLYMNNPAAAAYISNLAVPTGY